MARGAPGAQADTEAEAPSKAPADTEAGVGVGARVGAASSAPLQTVREERITRVEPLPRALPWSLPVPHLPARPLLSQGQLAGSHEAQARGVRHLKRSEAVISSHV